MIADSRARPHPRPWTRRAGWLLALSYGIGAPLTAYLEVTNRLFSARFDHPPALILAVCALQFICAFGVLVDSVAAWAAAALTVTTVGAIGSHIRIGSPLTAMPAVLFTVVQVWFAVATRRANAG
jgi:hypothetical protein